MHVFVWILVTLCSLKADLPVVIFGKGCPKVAGKENFDITRYVGQWYQLTALPFLFVNTATTCVWAKYAPLSNGNIAVNNTYIKDGKRTGITGEAAPIANRSGELDVEFFRSPSSTRSSNYYVLNTDYNEFSYVWSCASYYVAHSPKLWILNRNYNYTEAYVNQQAKNALEVLKSFGYDTDSTNQIWRDLVRTDQTNCDYGSYSTNAFKF